ncbi:MAG: sigma 54-interacting transcriptional regulator [Chloroflexota bacterium]
MLVSARDHLATLWQVATDAAILLDAQLRIAALNPAAERILGQSSRLAVGRPLPELVPSSELVGRLRKREGPAAGNLRLGPRSFRWSAFALALDDGSPAILLLLCDITEVVRLSMELMATEKLKGVLGALLNGAYEGIAVVDENGNVTAMNPAYCDFLQVKEGDVVGKPVQEVLENTRLHVVLKTGKPEFRQVQHIKGHDIVCDRIPIREGDRIVGAIGRVLFRDVSEVGQLLEQTRRLQQELQYYKDELRYHLQARYSMEGIVGQSQAIGDLKEMVRKVARSSSTVLLRGESGTGKELVAHAIHSASDRSRAPFVKVNCAAIPETLLESELFGYDEGAFTGARKGGKTGKFELANRGTVLLDEIGDMPLGMQAKLLRVLQEREVERVGGTRPIRVDVRVIAATNQDLEGLVAAGKFRHDLFYRLNVVAMEIPPVRDRREDIPVLSDSILEKLGRALGCGRKGIGQEALQVLLQHDWPGNVRELENVLERALNVVDGPVILPRHLPYYLGESKPSDSTLPHLRDALARAERELLKQALGATRGNHLKAARLLGLSKSTFYEKVARHDLR